MDWLFVTLASALAGFIDAIVGGGGLVLVPALFATFPQTTPATLLGTNKGASIWGTTFASAQYLRRVSLSWRVLAPAMGLAMVGSFVGAWVVTLVSADYLRKALPFVLVAVLLYTLVKKDMGQEHTPHHNERQQIWLAALIGAGIGFYDGFFGPGTGSFLVFLFVRVLGYDFLHASASAKLLNWSSNLAAITLFALKGHMWWQLALTMAVANVIGSLLGTRLALKHGAGFVRGMFIVVVTLLIAKTGFDAFIR
jgi:uncharacterized membrane protein YfcA